MTCSGSKKIALVTLALTTAIALVLTPAPRTDAADHRDGPILVGNVGADIGGVYLFLNPSDNTKVIAAMSVNGYIVPAENATAGFFDHTLRYRFQFENTGNAAGDISQRAARCHRQAERRNALHRVYDRLVFDGDNRASCGHHDRPEHRHFDLRRAARRPDLLRRSGQSSLPEFAHEERARPLGL
jgi:hypothetical protein